MFRSIFNYFTSTQISHNEDVISPLATISAEIAERLKTVIDSFLRLYETTLTPPPAPLSLSTQTVLRTIYEKNTNQLALSDADNIKTTLSQIITPTLQACPTYQRLAATIENIMKLHNRSSRQGQPITQEKKPTPLTKEEKKKAKQQKEALTLEQQNDLSDCLRGFLDQHNSDYQSPKILKATNRLKQFSQFDTHNFRLAELNDLRADMQTIYNTIRDRASEETLEQAAELVKQFNASLSYAPKEKYTSTVLTYNVGNNILHKAAIKSLRRQLFPDERTNPDLVFFMLQESKNSAWNGDSIPVRILKKRDGFTDLPYATLSDINVPVLTHPEDPRNRAFGAKTELMIAYNTSTISEDAISIKHRGECVSDDRQHKGGVFLILCVHGVNIAVLSVHLDSKNETTAKQQLIDLVEKCETECAEKGIRLDEMISAGDFNIRLHPETLTPSSSNRQTRNRHSIIKPSDLEEAVKTTNKIWQENFPELQQHELHAPTNELSYLKGNTLKPNEERNGKYDIGVLDMIAHKSYNTPETPFITIDETPSTSANIYTPGWICAEKHASDHHPVTGQFTLSNRLSREEKQNRATNETRTQELYQSAQHNRLKQYFPENELLTPTYIIDHLDVFYGKDVNAQQLINITFGTSEQIEANSGNTGQYMLKKFKQLLDSKTKGDEHLKIILLKPFREWLDSHNIERPHYYYSKDLENHYHIKQGFFSNKREPHSICIDQTRYNQL